RDVGHDAQCENRQALKLPAGEQIYESKKRPAALLEELRQLVRVHARGRNVSAQPVHRQQGQRKQDAFTQVRNSEDVRQLLKHYCKTSNLPPALVIFSCADFENLCACTVIADLSSPSPRILTGCLVLITPALRSTSGVMVVSPSAARRSRLTMLNSLRKILVKPRLGMRRCSGIWPPSKPRIIREPVRERCPLCPRVDVLPMPDPIPRPTRLRFSVAFFGARIFDKFMARFLLHNLDQVRDLGYHPTDRRVVGTLNHLVQPGEAQALDHEFLFNGGTNGGAHPLQVNLPA